MQQNAQECVWEKTPPLSGKNPNNPVESGVHRSVDARDPAGMEAKGDHRPKRPLIGRGFTRATRWFQSPGRASKRGSSNSSNIRLGKWWNDQAALRRCRRYERSKDIVRIVLKLALCRHRASRAKLRAPVAVRTQGAYR